MPSTARHALLPGLLLLFLLAFTAHDRAAAAEATLVAPSERLTLRVDDARQPSLSTQGWACGRDYASELIPRLYTLSLQQHALQRAAEALGKAQAAHAKRVTEQLAAEHKSPARHALLLPRSDAEGTLNGALRDAGVDYSYAALNRRLQADEKRAAERAKLSLENYFSADFSKQHAWPRPAGSEEGGARAYFRLEHCYDRGRLRALRSAEADALKGRTTAARSVERALARLATEGEKR